MGDGTYRFVGTPSTAPSLRWADAPITASDDQSADEDADPVEGRLAANAKRRWPRL